MDFEALFAKTPATLEEIRARVGYALERHPLCRSVKFDIVSMPRTRKGDNWTISLQAVAPDALCLLARARAPRAAGAVDRAGLRAPVLSATLLLRLRHGT